MSFIDEYCFSVLLIKPVPSSYFFVVPEYILQWQMETIGSGFCSYWNGTQTFIFGYLCVNIHRMIIFECSGTCLRLWIWSFFFYYYCFFTVFQLNLQQSLTFRQEEQEIKTISSKYKWRDINTLSVEQHVCHQQKSLFNTSGTLLGILIFASMRTQLSASQLSVHTSELLEWTSIQLYKFREKIHSLCKWSQCLCNFSEKLC